MGTHTYAILEVSAACYEEIKTLLEKAGYQHAFIKTDQAEAIDMHGIALAIKDSDGK